MKLVITLVFAASLVMVVIAGLFLADILATQSNGLEIAIATFAFAGSILGAGFVWSIYRRITRRLTSA